ncbi:dTMP kinase [Staphylococcus chromogenes]|nr:dTMP kinase [Staphylococcus chromogenes]
MIIAIEGIDGAGKNTLTTALVERIQAAGRSVATLAFPRYDESIFAELASRALYGKMGDLTDSAYGMATMFALDRRDALPQLNNYVGQDSCLLLDRYVASNAAYSVARTRDEHMAQWIADLEFGTFGLPKPDLQVLLSTPVAMAAERAQRREATDAARSRDVYESDQDLQARTAAAYRRLADNEWGSRWLVVDPGRPVTEVAEEILQFL